MSRQTTVPLRLTSAGGAGVTVTASSTAWAFGSWVELIASTSAVTDIAGLSFDEATGSIGSRFVEFQFGVGAASSEVAFGSLLTYSRNSNVQGHLQNLLAEKPFGNIPAGRRISVRIRHSGATSASVALELFYYESLTSLWKTSRAPVYAPNGATVTAMTPSGSAWTNSAWVQITSGLAFDLILQGICMNINGSFEYEIDLGTGAASSETVVTTFRGTGGGSAGNRNVMSCPPFTIPASTRIAARIRINSTSTNAQSVMLFGIDDSTNSTVELSTCGYGFTAG